MKVKNKIRAKRAIRATARKTGTTPKQCLADMQEAIDAAWATTDPAAKAYQEQLFPAGKPTVEEFIAVLGNRAKVHP